MMSVFIFPFLPALFFGQCFDVVKYDMVPVNPYKEIDLKDYSEKTPVNTFTSQFQVFETVRELEEFLGVNEMSFLKAEYDLWNSTAINKLLFFESDRSMKLTIALRIRLLTIRETIITSAPTHSGWKELQAIYGGTHYLKSIAYGAAAYSVIQIDAANKAHLIQIRNAFKGQIGYKGNFDDSFLEELQKLAEEADTWYGPIATVTFGTKEEHYSSVHKLLRLRNNLENNRLLLQENEAILFEFHPLSEISSLPPVFIEKNFVEEAVLLATIYEDARIANMDLMDYLNNLPMSDSQDSELADFMMEIRLLILETRSVVLNIDITTEGYIGQYDAVFQRYNSTDTKKYRRAAQNLIKKREKRPMEEDKESAISICRKHSEDLEFQTLCDVS